VSVDCNAFVEWVVGGINANRWTGIVRELEVLSDAIKNLESDFKLLVLGNLSARII